MQDVHGKLNILLSLQKLHSEIRNSFQWQLVLNFLEKKWTFAFAANDFYGGESCTLHKRDQKWLESFEMLCWRRTDKLSLFNFVGNQDVYI